ncbi:hypothetical protein LTR56_027414, partial [Elasticomyces elasticus]
MDDTNSTREYSSTRMTPPQQIAHERTTNMDKRTEKHQDLSVAFDDSSNLLQVRASGHKTHPEHLYTEHDEFVQNLHQQQDAGGKENTGPDESAFLERSQSGESVYEDAEELDLFTKSFPHAQEEDKHKKPEEADLVEDVRRSLTQQQKLHDKAKLFTPRLPLDVHRYWICVLHEGRKVSTITSEKHFTWMKGKIGPYSRKDMEYGPVDECGGCSKKLKK